MRARRRCSCEQAQASVSASVYTRVFLLAVSLSLSRVFHSLARSLARPLARSHANTCERTREPWKSDPDRRKRACGRRSERGRALKERQGKRIQKKKKKEKKRKRTKVGGTEDQRGQKTESPDR